MNRDEEQNTNEVCKESENDTESSQEHDLIENNDKKYTEKELEHQIAGAVNDALNSEFLSMLKNDEAFKEELLKDSLIPITSFKKISFIKSILLCILVYSGILAIYSVTTGQLTFNPKGAILLLGVLLALVDKTIRPLVLKLEKSLFFKTSGFLLIMVYSIVIYYVSIHLNKAYNIQIIFNSFYELFFIITILLLAISLVDYVVLRTVSNTLNQKLLLGSEDHD
ncbi:hypothetical protein [Haloplasma contractile]|uniref:Uncharacterized protein n=1 Tax=Haloplasma contractile SSD-17B TaxID=1033810 RepID=U2EE32_9MOLU|nr:hypothetical protein [Haloplasma contractile]ERJ10963.1 hypothetical protein HLPCO_003050 [Haloplasma contractile SSD-17B]ERJ12971.1 hypothetical protein HLPCO_000570 [Haloplasma contractile SSD-17B]